MKKPFLVLAAFALAFTGALVPSSARANSQEHCIVHTAGVDKTGDFNVIGIDCYDKFYQVLNAQGLEVSHSLTAAEAGPYLASASIIGIHYDGFNANGSSFAVEGTDCSGGGLPVPLVWNDRISSTTNGCGNIVHYQNTNYSGSVETTSGSGGNHNLSLLNNQTSSIRYFN